MNNLKVINKKLLVFLFLGIFLINLVSAESRNSIGVFRQGDCVELIQTCADCTYVKISSVSYPNSTKALELVTMTKTGTFYNYTFCDTSNLGIYKVDGYGDELAVDTVFSYTFEITYSGKNISSAQGILYIILFVVIFLTFIITIFGINKLPRYNQQDEEGRILSISYLKYLRPVLWFFEWMVIIGILYVSSNIAFAYLNEQLFAQILFTFFRIAFISLIVVIFFIILLPKIRKMKKSSRHSKGERF